MLYRKRKGDYTNKNGTPCMYKNMPSMSIRTPMNIFENHIQIISVVHPLSKQTDNQNFQKFYFRNIYK